MAPIGNAVFATLLMNDAYLPGAMVLGHSLRDRGAKGKLVVLAVVDKLAASTISELQSVYDEIVPVQQIMNKAPANLYLMNRPDLIGAFTKIQLWKQTQYKRIVYIDADVVALRAPNELLTMDTEFAAVPDIGWPDCFNSGLMVLNPNLADYYALLALAERGISFDGADQGLLNMHFTEWERLSFKYNCTPSGNYQYVPAYRHFQSSINLVHFIGRDKPWTLGRENRYNTGVYGELQGRWWAVYDKHYREKKIVYYEGQWQQAPKKLQDYVAGEETMYLPSYQAPPPQSTLQPSSGESQHITSEQPMGDQPTVEEQITSREFEPTPTVQQRRWSAPHTDWEPAKAPPPADSKPEASNFPSQVYDFSDDTKLFQPPSKYPEAPKDMWYEVPKKVEQPVKPKPIFPWEERAPKPTRVFPTMNPPSPPIEPRETSIQPVTRPTDSAPFTSRTPIGPYPPRGVPENVTPSSRPSTRDDDARAIPVQPTATLPDQPSVTTSEPVAESTTRPNLESDADSPKTSPSATDQTDGSETSAKTPKETWEDPSEPWREPYVSPWETFSQRTNAWDDMPEIVKYVQALQPPKRGKIQVLHHTPSTSTENQQGQRGRRESLLITDFPTAIERPSLPVTPAPIRRPTNWGDEKDMSGELPNAEGVPDQGEWVRRFSSYPTPAFARVPSVLRESNGIVSFECQHCGKQNPVAKLDELQRRQSEALMAMEQANLLREPPRRDLPESASLEAVEAAVDKVHSPTSTRPLKPILKEPHFELSAPPKRNGAETSGSVHDSVTEEVLSPGDTGESTSNTPTPRPQVAA